MKLAIMQPYFFPYIGYFQLLHASDTFVFYDDVNFIKGGWIHRNRVLVGGEPAYLSSRLSGASSFKKINDIALDPSSEWRNKLVRKLEHCYSRAPEFSSCFPFISETIKDAGNSLAALAKASVLRTAEYLSLTRTIVHSSEMQGAEELKGQERILILCKRLAATTYINPPGGRDLYSRETFKQNGIELRFLNPKPLPYRQFENAFVANLSIIDVLMFNTIEACRQLLGQYELN